MSIFKDTFHKHIKNQILARQALLAIEGDRPIQVQQYTLNRSPWVRMTSLVEYNGSVNLAKKNILEGGTLYAAADVKTKQKTTRLRSGIGQKDSAYGSTTMGNKDYGLRPMPGITSVSITSKGAYGSLREATVKFFAWDLKQLETMVILYMKPFYPVVLEWGWSKYIDDANSDIPAKNFAMKNADGIGVDCFASNISIDGIYKRLDELNIANRGNYEGMLGFIKNYEYVLLPNGGFECTTILISIGEIISGLRLDSTGGDANITNPNDEVKDNFELLLENLATTGNRYPISVNNSGIDTDIYSFQPLSQVLSISQPAVANFSATTQNTSIGQSTSAMPNTANLDMKFNSYMQLAYLVAIINEKASLFTPNGTTVTTYEIPLTNIPGNLGNGLCLSSYNAMTIDNSVCLIQNNKASLLKTAAGFTPQVAPIAAGTGAPNLSSYYLKKEYLYDNTNLGIIGNIYVNLGRVLSIYKSLHKSNGGRVASTSFLQAVLNEVSYALGSINYFDVFVDKNRAVIIDKHYVEDPKNSSYDIKAKINIAGTGTTVRDHKVMSKIFEEQASMIAIAAQNVENIGSYQTSTNVFMNKNIVNRLYKNSAQTKDVAEDLAQQLAKDQDLLYNNIRVLLSYVNSTILTGKASNTIEVSALNVFLNNLLVVVDRGTDYKGIVPLSLEIKMDGIGGVVIGQIFTIQKDILPLEYSDKRIGFIVTRISQEITRPDWTTTLTAQFCLLDQVQRQEAAKARAVAIQGPLAASITAATVDVVEAIVDYNSAICYMSDVISGAIEVVFDANGKLSDLKYKKGVLGRLAAYQPNEYAQILDLAKSNTISGAAQNLYTIKTESGELLKDLYTFSTADFINLTTGTLTNASAVLDDTVNNISKYLVHVLRTTFPRIKLNSDIDNRFVSTYNRVVVPAVDGSTTPLLNEYAVDPLGIIIPSQLELKTGVTIKYPGYFTAGSYVGTSITNALYIIKTLL